MSIILSSQINFNLNCLQWQKKKQFFLELIFQIFLKFSITFACILRVFKVVCNVYCNMYSSSSPLYALIFFCSLVMKLFLKKTEHNFRKSNLEADLAAQLDVFDEQYKSDEADRQLEYKNLDLDSPTDIFYAILKQVTNSKLLQIGLLL